jgi:predicted nucleic acid-binding protein
MAKLSFDTNAAIAEIKNNAILSSAKNEIIDAEKYISVIVRTELLCKRDMSNEEESKIRAFLKRVIVIPYGEEIENETIRIRRTTRLKLPDAIIAATAAKLGATLLSFDSHFDNLNWPGLTVQQSI